MGKAAIGILVLLLGIGGWFFWGSAGPNQQLIVRDGQIYLAETNGTVGGPGNLIETPPGSTVKEAMLSRSGKKVAALVLNPDNSYLLHVVNTDGTDHQNVQIRTNGSRWSSQYGRPEDEYVELDIKNFLWVGRRTLRMHFEWPGGVKVIVDQKSVTESGTYDFVYDRFNTLITVERYTSSPSPWDRIIG